MSPADELRAAATRLEEAAATHDGDKVDVWAFAAEWMDPWVQLMSPALAAPLVDLFRTRARGAEAFEDTLAGGDEFTPEQVRETSEKNLRLELSVARAINGTTS